MVVPCEIINFICLIQPAVIEFTSLGFTKNRVEVVILILGHDWNRAIIDGVVKIPEGKIVKFFITYLTISLKNTIKILAASHLAYARLFVSLKARYFSRRI